VEFHLYKCIGTKNKNVYKDARTGAVMHILSKRRCTMNRKGQAAMEFLMTYGWAILAAIIAIGVLAYFGVFSPGKYVTGSAVVNPPFYANAWNVVSGTGVSIELRNNGGEDYSIQSATVTPTSAGVTCTAMTTATPITAGGTATLVVPCTGLTSGDTFKGDLTVVYRKTGSDLDLTSTGTIAEKITA
jgi:hypothetical protein